MGKPVRLDGVIALEVEQRFNESVAGRIAILEGDDIRPEGGGDAGVVGDSLAESLRDHGRQDGGVAEPIGHPLDDRVLQPHVIEHGEVHEATERRLVLDDSGRLAPDARPHRVDGV